MPEPRDFLSAYDGVPVGDSTPNLTLYASVKIPQVVDLNPRQIRPNDIEGQVKKYTASRTQIVWLQD